MKRSINLKVLGILVLVVGATAGGVHLLHQVQVRRSSGAMLRKANTARDAGKVAEQVDYLKRYLAYQPNDYDALEQYGLVLASSGARKDRDQAMEILDRVVTVEPSRSATRRHLAELARELGAIETARHQYEALAGASPEGDAEAEEAVGRCEEDLKRNSEALDWYEKAIKHDPKRVVSYVRSAHLLRTQSANTQRADALMDAIAIQNGIIANNPQSARASLERAGYRREFKLPGSEDDIRHALTLEPGGLDVLLAGASIAAPEEAARLLSRALASHPTDPRSYERLALLEASQGRLAQAIDHLKAGTERLPTANHLRWLLAELEINDGKYAEAGVLIGRLRAAGLPAPLLDFLDARILIQSQRWTEATRQLTRVAPNLELAGNTTTLAKRAFLLLAQTHGQLGNPDLRHDAARRAVMLTTDDPALTAQSHTELAAALTDLGRLDEAAEEYRVALRLGGARPELRTELVRVLVLKNLRLQPSQRRWDEVEPLLVAPTEATDSPNRAILRADVYSAQGQLEQAGKVLRQARSISPQAAIIRVALANLAERQGQPAEALALLESARRELGDRPEVLATLGRYWSFQPRETAVPALTSLVDAAKALSGEAERRFVLGVLAEGLDRAGATAPAVAIRDRLVADQPDHLGLRLTQLNAAMRAGDTVAAGQILNEVRRLEGAEGALWRYTRAQLLVLEQLKTHDPKLLDEAANLLAEAKTRRPGWSKVTLAAAEVDELRGDLGAAARGFQAALDQGERDPQAIRRFVQVLYRQGRFAQAATLLGRVQQEGTLAPELDRLAAAVAFRAHDEDRAIALARRAVASRPDAAADQTWLGQLLAAAARQADNERQTDLARQRRLEAEKALVRGVELAPNEADGRIALILTLASWGRVDEARARTRDAESVFKGPTGDLALAQCYEAIGQPAQAEAKYAQILRERPDDLAGLQAAATSALRAGKVREAEPRLRRLIALGDQNPGEAAWARRALALAFAGEGLAGVSKARALLGLDEEATTSSAASKDRTDLPPDDLRTRARVLARQPGRSSRRQALELIDVLTRREEAQPADQFLQAQLLAAEGDWKRAQALAQQLLGNDPTNPTLLVFLARGLIASPAPEAATPWIDALAKVDPQASVVTELRARSLVARKQVPEAIASLDALARRNPNLGISVAALLAELGEQQAAESLLRRLDSAAATPQRRVDAALALAGLLGRLNRHAEAITICERLWADPAVAPSRTSSVALVALYTGRPDAAVFQRVEAGITAALQQQPTDLLLRFDRANLAILQGRYTDAESMLRTVRQTNPALAAPLNNLAWLLALRGEGGKQPLDLIDRAIALDGPQPSLLDTRGLILTLQNQPDRAVSDFEESIAAAPSSSGYFHLAMALRKTGRSSEAAEAIGKAWSLGLRASDVHPLERPAYLELVAAFPQK